MIDWNRLNPEVISEFRANGGVVERFGGLPIVILHTIGARSGRVREVPLIPVQDGDTTLLFGSSAGSQKHPDWVYNLRAHPRIAVEGAGERFEAELVELPEAERRLRVEKQARETAQFAEYVTNAAPREIPVFTIQRLGAPS